MTDITSNSPTASLVREAREKADDLNPPAGFGEIVHISTTEVREVVGLIRRLSDALDAQGVSDGQSKMWECEACGFGMDAIHTDADGGYTCPVCVASEDSRRLKGFARDVLHYFRESASMEAGDIQEMAIAAGLLIPIIANVRCGESCPCAEFGFPTQCNRLSSSLISTDRQETK